MKSFPQGLVVLHLLLTRDLQKLFFKEIIRLVYFYFYFFLGGGELFQQKSKAINLPVVFVEPAPVNLVAEEVYCTLYRLKCGFRTRSRREACVTEYL